MNRRKFLKAGLIWVPAFPAIVHAQSEDWFRVASEGVAAASGGVCAITTMKNTVNNDQAGLGTIGTQAVQLVGGAATICQVDLVIDGNIGGGTIKCQVRTAQNGGGSQLGGDSNTLTPANSTQTLTFTWSSNKPPVSADFFLNFVGNGSAMSIALDSTKAYVSTYQWFVDATGHNWGSVFDVWTMQ